LRFDPNFRQADSILAAVVLVLAIVALLFGGQLIAEPPIALSRDISPLNPRLFPTLVLTGLIVVCATFLGLRPWGPEAGVGTAAVSEEPVASGGTRRLLIFLFLTIFCAHVLNQLGFLTTMFVLMVGTSVLVGNKNIPQVLCFSIGLPLLLYVLVTHLLRTSLPELDFVESALAPILAMLPNF
jgi:hypothetical protein